VLENPYSMASAGGGWTSRLPAKWPSEFHQASQQRGIGSDFYIRVGGFQSARES
jgi:hypothetical protein